MRNKLFYTVACTLCIILAGCSDYGRGHFGEPEVTSHRIAVILPSSDGQRWKRTVKWAIDNINRCQQGLPVVVKIEVAFYDENHLDTYLNTLVDNPDIEAIIGPLYSSDAVKVAAACGTSGKTVILPVVTSTEFQRLYGSQDYVWNLCQSDITQCEIMLVQAKLSGSRSVTLISSDDDYGKSFSDWAAYMATEMGLEYEQNRPYTDEDSLRSLVRKYKGCSEPEILFTPSKGRDAEVFDEEIGKMKKVESNFVYPEVLCSDIVCSSTLAGTLTNMHYEGLAPCADPSSGFDAMYKSKFGCSPVCGEAHLFDAVCIAAYGFAAKQDTESLNSAIKRVVDGRTDPGGGWMPLDMFQNFQAIASGAAPDICGATGDLTFDERHHSSVLNTIYCHWRLVDSGFLTMEYLSTDGSLRTTSAMQAWDWNATVYDEFDNNQIDYNYQDLKGRWAIVVATSDIWAYYRHQADALAMYQLLKRHGYDDDHIVLIMEDNLANNPNNIYPGCIKVRPDGDNLYHDVTVDYHLSQINISDLKDIMLGNASSRLPNVISSTANDNVIVFWCGHGNYNTLMWGETYYVSGRDIRDIVTSMHEEKKYRKMMFVVDACYSGSIGTACSGIAGTLFMTAANENETSKADMKDPEMGIWLSNSFTRAFQETIDATPSISLRDLYYILARNTAGSHASVYNEENYGNMYHQSMEEYLSAGK